MFIQQPGFVRRISRHAILLSLFYACPILAQTAQQVPESINFLNAMSMLRGLSKGYVIGWEIFLLVQVIFIVALIRYKRREMLIQRSLWESQAQYQAMVDLDQNAIIVFDFNLAKVVDANSKAEALFGISREEIMKDGIRKYYLPGQFGANTVAEHINNVCEQALAGKLVHTQVRPVVNGQGKIIFCECWTSRLPSNDRKLIRVTYIDITERIQREEQTQRLLTEQQTILRNAMAGIAYANNRFIISCNRRFEEMFGYEEGELIGASSEIVYVSHEDFVTIGERAYQKMENNRSYSEELMLRRRDGSLFWAAMNGSAYDPDHPQEGSIWIYTDVSKRYQAEQALRDSESHLRTLINTIPDLIWLKNVDGVYLICNPVFESFFGAKEADIVGKTDYDFVDHELADSFRENDRKALVANAPYTNEEWLTFTVGGYRGLFETIKTPMYDSAGKLIGVLGVARDITKTRQAEEALRQSEARFYAIFEHAQDGIVLTDAETGRFFTANKMFLEMTGYTLDEITQLGIDDLHPKTDVQIIYEGFNKLIHGENLATVSIPMLCRDGNIFYADVSTTTLELNGRLYALAEFRDVTERRFMHQQIEEHQEHLETLVEIRTVELSKALEAAQLAELAKDSFLANISHELRTPLNVVIGYSGLMRDASVDPKQRKYMERIFSAGKNLSAIIDDLLDLSKINAGSMNFESIAFSLSELINHCVESMENSAANKELQLVVRIGEIPDVLIGDPLRLEQIIFNLLSNAIKFTQAGRIEVRVYLASREEDRLCLGIEVEDTGIGMHEEDIAHLFKPFAQTDNSITRTYGGTGLGLAICKRLAEMMDGNISATSCFGSGTTFQVKVWLGINSGKLPIEANSDSAKPAQIRYHNAKVLVVDDLSSNRDIVEELLLAVGIVPYLAPNGRVALDILSEAGPAKFDLVLMDLQMPEMDGITATRAIREMAGFEKMIIIAMTARTMSHEKEKSRSAGMNDHIGKPFDIANFYHLLAKWIGHNKRLEQPGAAMESSVTTGNSLPNLRTIDTETGLARFAGNEKRYRHCLTNFIKEAPDFTTEIQRSLAAGELEQARKSVHAIKGQTGMLGMNDLHAIATELEAAFQRGDAPHDLINSLQLTIQKLCDELTGALDIKAPEPPLSEHQEREG
ncbi:MAG: hypothetical protein H6R18_179 [Proteobacteria bacterium]|nr:hypothetical protein [Pseudomonadota bacterium]